MTALITPNARLTIDGTVWTVLHLTLDGTVTLRNGRGDTRHQLVTDLLADSGLTEVSDQRPGAVDRLTQEQRAHLQARLPHIREALTGYRSGNPLSARPNEPKAMYDPAHTSLRARIAAKAAELDHEGFEAAGLRMSESTLRRQVYRFRDMGADGLVDLRHLSRRPKRTAMTAKVVTVVTEIIDGYEGRSNIGMRTLHRNLQMLLMERYPDEYPKASDCPAYSTVHAWFHEHYPKSTLTGMAKYRTSRNDAPPTGWLRRTPTRPGEIVVVDTSGLDVRLVKDDGTHVSGVLVTFVDWYSRSIVGLRVFEKSESAFDVTAELFNVSRPTPMRPGWSERARWPFVGMPETAVLNMLEDTGPVRSGVAGIPIVQVESLVPDHGSTYKARVNMRAAESIGTSVVPARLGTPTDKAMVERVFGAIRSMVLEHLDGYRGRNPGERGHLVDSDACLTAQEMEDLLMRWVAEVWQFHTLEQARPPWCAEGDWSPNRLFEAALNTTGFAVSVPALSEYMRSRPSTYVAVSGRGIKVKGLWYDTPDLGRFRNQPSPLTGRHNGKYEVRFDTRDLSTVYLHVPLSEEWISVPLAGMLPDADMPPFTDRHLAAARRDLNARHLVATQDELVATLLAILRDNDQSLLGTRSKERQPTTKDGGPETSGAGESSSSQRAADEQAAVGLKPPAPVVRVTDEAVARAQINAAATAASDARPDTVGSLWERDLSSPFTDEKDA